MCTTFHRIYYYFSSSSFSFLKNGRKSQGWWGRQSNIFSHTTGHTANRSKWGSSLCVNWKRLMGIFGELKIHSKCVTKSHIPHDPHKIIIIIEMKWKKSAETYLFLFARNPKNIIVNILFRHLWWTRHKCCPMTWLLCDSMVRMVCVSVCLCVRIRRGLTVFMTFGFLLHIIHSIRSVDFID